MYLKMKVISTTIRPSKEVEFYLDIDLINHIFDNYLYNHKIETPETILSNDQLTKITSIVFNERKYFFEFLHDQTVVSGLQKRDEYNKTHGITYSVEKFDE